MRQDSTSTPRNASRCRALNRRPPSQSHRLPLTVQDRHDARSHIRRGQIFIAEHGSWNRSAKIGYRVTVVSLDANGRAIAYEPFAEGWLQGQQAWGRPTDVAVAPDGSLLVADDAAGAIYRIRYRRP